MTSLVSGSKLTSAVSKAVSKPIVNSWVGGLAVMLLWAHISAAEDTKVVLGKKWPAAERVSIDKIDHKDWTRLTKSYVDAAGNVDYAKWSHQAKDTAALDRYLEILSQADPKAPSERAAQLAFWINAYNAIVVRVLLDQPPLPNQKRAVPERLWTDWCLRVGDGQFSLDQIENEQLRKMRDPRIHFAIVCGAKGCPRLRNEAYTAAELESQLSQNSREFFADPTKFKFDPSTKQLKLSPIIKWYADDFGRDVAGRLKSISPYLPEAAQHSLETNAAPQIDYLDYDAEINQRTLSDSPRVDK